MPLDMLNAERVTDHTIAQLEAELSLRWPPETRAEKLQIARAILLAGLGAYHAMTFPIGYAGCCPVPSDN